MDDLFDCVIECGCGVRHKATLPAAAAGIPPGTVEGSGPGHGRFPVSRGSIARLATAGVWVCPNDGQRPRP